MTSKKTTAGSTTARPTCNYPGCDQLAAPAEHPGRPPEYCAGRGHTRASAWKERRRMAAEKNGTTISVADDANPVTMAKVSGAELLRSLRTEADRIAALGKDLRERIDVLTDPPPPRRRWRRCVPPPSSVPRPPRPRWRTPSAAPPRPTSSAWRPMTPPSR